LGQYEGFEFEASMTIPIVGLELAFHDVGGESVGGVEMKAEGSTVFRL
jgi:hypothetical protein